MSTDTQPELGMTEADRQRAAALAAKNGTVTAEMCADWRRRIAEGDEIAREIAGDPGVPWSLRAINDHASGRCGHEVDEPAVGPADPNTASPLSRRECAAIRRLDEQGLSNGEIALDVDRSEASVYRHLNGQCSHDRGEDGESS